ncbi:hypothetical protein EXIGLDRAFT_771627 [Exidia glandulosa HHB12029]|uniref:Uncharacterized protein n=1 Tax=Exidia glandulosa HHB12029 TaxID=1314781 RepID=A0A165FUX9_EXIGL|nr:hypothetical protein EXIGLDRAFT_771627 [Exidia glandulosa HHB12029]
MAFLSVNSTPPKLIRDLWDKPRLSTDPIGIFTCKEWEVVPYDSLSLVDWLHVVPKNSISEKSRPYYVVHKSYTSGDPTYEVTLRIQGFLKSSVLSPIGTWDGDPSNAHLAVQRIVLGGGETDDAWISTLKQLNRVISVVTRKSGFNGSPHLLTESVGTVIPFQRRVFLKAANAPPFSVQNIGDELLPYAARLQDMSQQWVTDAPLLTGALRTTGVRRCNHALFRDGDFVDVLASFEIVCKKQVTRVYFAFDRIVQLAARDEGTGGTSVTPAFGAQDVLRAPADDIFVDTDDEDAGEED